MRGRYRRGVDVLRGGDVRADDVQRAVNTRSSGPRRGIARCKRYRRSRTDDVVAAEALAAARSPRGPAVSARCR